MKIYNYQHQTFEYLDESEADESPLEPGVFLIPAYSTTKKPIKSKDGFAVVFANDKWIHVEDHRNEIWFEENGNPVKIMFIGNPSERGLLQTKPDIVVKTETPVEENKPLSYIINEWMDKKAIEYGYYSHYSAISYAEEPAVPLFQKQGKAFRKWRSLVWEAAIPLLTSIEKGEAKIPDDINSYLKTLPQFVVPEA